MRRALALALENVRRGWGGPFGALVVRQGAWLAEGVNSVTRLCDPTAHAEMVAIRGACLALGSFRLDGCILYTSCEPCPMCLGAIYWARLSAVFYAGGHADAAQAGFDDSFIYRQFDVRAGERAIPMRQILHDESRAPLEEWQRSTTKVPY